MSTELDERLEFLRLRMLHHPSVAAQALGLPASAARDSSSGSDRTSVPLYMLDLLTVAVLDRSMSLHRALYDLLSSQNYPCAAALVRYQLDSCMRYYAFCYLLKPDESILSMLDGARLDRAKDREGNRLTDKYLLTRLLENYPQIRDRVIRVYDSTSGFIHLSRTHMHLAAGLDSLGPPLEIAGAPILLRVSGRYERMPESLPCEVLDGFRAITDILFDLIDAWTTSRQYSGESVTRKDGDHSES